MEEFPCWDRAKTEDGVVEWGETLWPPQEDSCEDAEGEGEEEEGEEVGVGEVSSSPTPQRVLTRWTREGGAGLESMLEGLREGRREEEERTRRPPGSRLVSIFPRWEDVRVGGGIAGGGE